MRKYGIVLSVLFLMNCNFHAQEITPHKLTDTERSEGICYTVPQSSRFTIFREDECNSDIIYYFSKPKTDVFPIAVLCGGSSLEDDIVSIIHFHRYFLQEFLDLGVAVLTVEQQGVDGNNVNVAEFMKNYTRSNRLRDHCKVVDYLKSNPPHGWNGKLVFLGVSEGGPIITTLTTKYSDSTIATINWSGAGDFSWQEELWDFIQDMKTKLPWHVILRTKLPSWMPFSLDLYCPRSKKEHDKAMQKTIDNPTADLKLAGMTYKYHANALRDYPAIEYEKIKTPYLVVVGENDSIAKSAQVFVKKAQKVDVPITCMCIKAMDHYVRKREDAIVDSFNWLKNYL